MSAYWAIIRARFQVLMQYRAAAFAGFCTQCAFGLIMLMSLEAFYRSSRTAQPMTFPQVVTYIWLGQAFLGMLPWNIDRDVAALIRNGNVAYELLRPLDLYNLWYSRVLALRTAPTLLRAVPMFIVAGLFFGLQAPASPAAGAAWLATMVGALLLGCAITNLMNISLLWTLSGDGIMIIITAAVTVFSGMVIPLPLFPDWAQTLLNILPFRGLVDWPYRLYCGNLPVGAVWGVLAQQLVWTLALVLLGRWLLARGVRRLVVQGG